MIKQALNFLPQTVFVFIAASLSNVVVGESESQEVSFANDILPEFEQQCSYCHRPYDRHGYLVLDHDSSYDAIVNVPSFQLPTMDRVEPGKPEESYLWRKGIGTHVEVGGKGWNMPVMIGLRGEFKEKLRLWIEQGAKNN